MSNLLIDDGQLLILETRLAVLIGDRPAIALQQIHYWIEINRKQKKEDHFFDGAWWVYNTWAEWHEGNFPFWSERTVRRIFDDLAKPENERPILIITRPHENSSKGNWIRIDYEAWSNWLGTVDKMTSEGGQNVQTLSTTENTKKITTDKPRAARSRLSFTPRQYTPSKAASPRIYQIVKHWLALNNPASFYADETEKPAQALLDAGYAVETITAILDWKASQQYLPTLKKTCTEIGAWIKEYERRAKNKPASVPTNGTTTALQPIIPDVMDGHIELPQAQYESEF